MGTMARVLGSLCVIALMGAVVALVGAGSHRALSGVGLVLCLLLVGVGTVFVRAWRDRMGLAVFGVAWAVMTVVLAGEGPGGSLLIVRDVFGYGWLGGGVAMLVAVAVVPRRRFEGDA